MFNITTFNVKEFSQIHIVKSNSGQVSRWKIHSSHLSWRHCDEVCLMMTFIIMNIFSRVHILPSMTKEHTLGRMNI